MPVGTQSIYAHNIIIITLEKSIIRFNEIFYSSHDITYNTIVVKSISTSFYHEYICNIKGLIYSIYLLCHNLHRKLKNLVNTLTSYCLSCKQY